MELKLETCKPLPQPQSAGITKVGQGNKVRLSDTVSTLKKKKKVTMSLCLQGQDADEKAVSLALTCCRGQPWQVHLPPTLCLPLRLSGA